MGLRKWGGLRVWGEASELSVLDTASVTQSLSNNDGVVIGGLVSISDSANISTSFSHTDSILIPEEIIINDGASTSISISNFDSISIGEFLFTVNSQTNINGVYYSTNING